jgi:hypothetical protein
VSAWDRVVPRYIDFCRRHLRETGFRPSLFTEVYFIARDDRSLLSFAPDEHVFTLDVVDNCRRPEEWRRMNVEYNRLAAALGGRPVLNQTKALDLTPGIVAQCLPAWRGFRDGLGAAARERFCRGTFFDRV